MRGHNPLQQLVKSPEHPETLEVSVIICFLHYKNQTSEVAMEMTVEV